MALFDSITNLFSGGGQSGYGDMQNEIQKAQDSLNKYYSQGQQGMNPYAQAGTNALNNYQNFYQGMADPQAYYNKVMSGWSMSPGAQMNEKYGTKAMNQAAAASGIIGNPGQQEQVGQYMNNLVDTDQQNYLNNVLGIGKQYGDAEGNLMNQGYNSSNALLNSFMGQGNMNANLYGQMGQSQLQQQMARGGGINDILGMGIDAFGSSGMGKQFMNWWGS